jgi:hypothetical protein
MNTASPGSEWFRPTPPVLIKSLIQMPIAFVAEDAIEAEERLLSILATASEGSLIEINLEGSKVSSEAARQLLRRALLRTTGGEHPDRFLVLSGLGASRYNLIVMLQTELMTMVERGSGLIGSVDRIADETYKFLVANGTATAAQVCDHFGLSNISTASNRLSALAKQALARRVEQRPASGGGREFVFAPVT